jgi:uncharacterized phage protein gp47/JayE
LTEGAGQVDLYIYGSAGAPSPELLANAQARLDGTIDVETQTITPGYRPVGVRVTALPMDERALDVGLRVTMFDGQVFGEGTWFAIRDALSLAMAAVLPGATLYVAQLVEAVLAVPGIQRAIISNDANVVCGQHDVLVLGEIQVDPIE